MTALFSYPWICLLALFLLTICQSTKQKDLLTSDFTEMRFITVATDTKKLEFRQLIQSANKYNITYKVDADFAILTYVLIYLGADLHFQVLGKGKRYAYHGTKLFLLRQELEKVKHRNDIIAMFTDAYDVILFGNTATILNTFRSFNANVVFGAEHFCFPEKSLQNHFPIVTNGKILGILK